MLQKVQWVLPSPHHSDGMSRTCSSVVTPTICQGRGALNYTPLWSTRFFRKRVPAHERMSSEECHCTLNLPCLLGRKGTSAALVCISPIPSSRPHGACLLLLRQEREIRDPLCAGTLCRYSAVATGWECAGQPLVLLRARVHGNCQPALPRVKP